MKLILISAEPEEIRQFYRMGIFVGVASNPSLVAAAGLPSDDLVRAVLPIVPDPVFIQVSGLQAEEMIDVQVQSFMGWVRAQGAVGAIRQYRDKADAVRQQVLDKAKRLLAQGRPPEEVVEFLAHTLTNKLTHEPTTALNRAAREAREDLISAAQEMFDLPDDSTPVAKK